MIELGDRKTSTPEGQKNPRVINERLVREFRSASGQLGLDDEFKLLGMIPYPHMVALMRASMAVVNPSLFEGWSTTVEEAKAMGTPMLLSDIPVHREQMGMNACYFSTDSPQSMADAILQCKPLDEKARSKRSEKAREDAVLNVQQFAQIFADMVKHCQRACL